MKAAVLQDYPVCARCRTPIIYEEVLFASLCGHTACVSVCWHGTCLMDYLESEEARHDHGIA